MKTQSIEVRTLKHQIASCLKLIELKVRSAVLRLLDLEEQLKKELKKAMMTTPKLPVKKVYKKFIVNLYSRGEIEEKEDNYIFRIRTKPNGSECNWLSIGRFVSKKDIFGDTVTEWHHSGYPKEIEAIYQDFKVKAEYEGRGAAQRIYFTFIIPKSFIEEGYGIALMYASEIGVVLDKERLEE